jgi:uncharacterized protein
MTVELRPLGVLCNLACDYCYQNPQREAGNIPRRYDIGLMKAGIEAEGGPFTLFGGEPLLLSLTDLEDLWAWGFEKYGSNSVQTNGTTLRPEHIDLIKRYNVHVGLSLDGPGELNAVRRTRSGSEASTAKATAKAERALDWLCEEGVRPGLIVTLHRLNARADVLDRMNAWFRRLDGLGLRSVVLHVLESENAEVRDAYGLSSDENIAAFMNFLELSKSLTHIRFSVFDEIRALLMGDDGQAPCVWTGCDPYTTRAVRGVEGHGKRSNCGRVNKEGIDFVKADGAGFERYVGLYFVDQEDGGCSGCRFFLMCKGYCPGTAIEGDWRNRTEHCELWKALFTHFETELRDAGLTPLSISGDRQRIEQQMVAAWRSGENPTLSSLAHPA